MQPTPDEVRVQPAGDEGRVAPSGAPAALTCEDCGVRGDRARPGQPPHNRSPRRLPTADYKVK